APTDKQAREEARPGMTVDIEEQKIGRPALYRRYIPEGGTIADVNYDYLVERGMIIVGSPDTVCERIKALYDATGGFGALLITAGRDWSTREKRARSLRLIRDQVAPYLADLDPDSRGGYAVGYCGWRTYPPGPPPRCGKGERTDLPPPDPGGRSW